MIQKNDPIHAMHILSILIISLFAISCTSHHTQYDLDSVAHYATRHSMEEGWQLEAIEPFNLGEFRGPYFEIVYFGQNDLSVPKMRNFLIHHVMNYLEDNEKNQKLISYIKAKDNLLTYRNISIDLSFYEKKENKTKVPFAFLTYHDETVRYWIHNDLTGKYELVHVESIHEALHHSPVCQNKEIVQEHLHSDGELL